MFFFKQKTAYEMRISDWSSDVCSSDLDQKLSILREAAGTLSARLANNLGGMATIQAYTAERFEAEHLAAASDAYRARNIAAIRFSAAITPVIRIAILFGFVSTLQIGRAHV